MRVEGTRLVRDGKRAILAAVASVLLASCATSETEPFGFAVPAPSSTASQSGDFATATMNSTASQGSATGEFVMDENDPVLPEQVAELPLVRPGSEAAAAEPLALVEAQPAAAESQDQIAAQIAAAHPEQPAAATADAAPQAQPQATQFLENAPAQQATVAAAEPPKRGFLSALFGTQAARAAPQQQPAQALIPQDKAAATQPLVQLASTAPAAATRPLIASGAATPLPGVRDGNSLFEISRRSGMDDDSDIDLYEDAPVQVASAAGLARLAPNGLMKQTDHVDVACLKPSLVRVLKAVESHYGRKAVVTSGYRSADRNRQARGARNSLHMYCAAADVQVEGVTKWQLAEFVRTMPGRGGVGTYCHTESVHIDVGPERDWNWRCRRRK